jgi:hypothetical protein
MADAMRGLGRPDAAQQLAALVLAAHRRSSVEFLDLGHVPADRSPTG